MKIRSRKNLYLLFYIIFAFVIVFLIFEVISALVWKTNVKLDAVYDPNTPEVTLKWDSEKALDKVIIKSIHDGKTLSIVTLKDKELIAEGNITLKSFYGRQKYELKFCRGLYSKKISKTVDFYTNEYNIAVFAGSMPSTTFSLSLKEITKNYTIPTFVWFRRYKVWNWEYVPEKVYHLPVVSYKSGNKIKAYKNVKKWIKELNDTNHDINSSPFFHLYYNDFDVLAALDAVFGNNLKNYELNLLSDGVGSILEFNKCFNHESDEENNLEFEKLKKSYLKLKNNLLHHKSHSYRSTSKYMKYTYVIAELEENIHWWLNSIDSFAPNNENMKNALQNLINQNKIVDKRLNKLFTSIDDEQKSKLKKLFNFSDGYFNKAKEERKQIMVILGTYNSDELDFEGYVKAIKYIYGDKYIYYYKGHPYSPTETIFGKAELLEKLGLIDIDSNIPAELIYFFNEEAKFSGYFSTTFDSMNDERCGVIFNEDIDIDSAGDIKNHPTIKEKIKIFISKIRNGSTVGGQKINNNDSYLFEYMKNGVCYKKAIFNVIDGNLKDLSFKT